MAGELVVLSLGFMGKMIGSEIEIPETPRENLPLPSSPAAPLIRQQLLGVFRVS